MITILGVIASLLQPSLKSIASAANTLQCSQQLTHFYFATYHYTEDWDGQFIPYTWGVIPAPLERKMWFELLEDYHDRIDEARICPQTELKLTGGSWGTTDLTWRWGQYHGSYAYNSYFHSIYYRWGTTLEEMPPWFQNYHFIKMQNVRFPSKTGIMGDSSWVDTWPRNFQSGPRTASLGGQPRESGMSRLAVNRHDWGINVLKADGSAGYHKLEELWDSLYWNLTDKPQAAPTINP